MKCIIASLFFTLSALFCNAQDLSIKVKSNLSDTVSESSGLVNLKGRFFTHEDSGGEPFLYEIDTANGTIIRNYKVKGAQNVDWEDLASDDRFLYIGDFGNNAGMRKDLCIYKLSIADVLSGDTQNAAQKIFFNYEGQKDFSNRTYQTNYDAESLVSIGDSLYIFSKNWGNFKSYIYPISKTPGNYTISILDSMNVQGLVTGASYSAKDSVVILCGYNFNFPFVVQLKMSNGLFACNQFKKTDFPSLGVVQIEAICMIDSTHFFLTCEKNTTNAQLYILSILKVHSGLQYNKSLELLLYPNPVTNFLTVKSSLCIKKIQIFNIAEQLILVSTINFESGSLIDLSYFPIGRYLFAFEDEFGRKHTRTIVK